MRFLIRLLPHQLPKFLRKKILAELFYATADAFQVATPQTRHLTYEERLQVYALFTKTQAEKSLQSGADQTTMKARLQRNAARLGMKLRRWFDPNSTEEAMRLGQIFYRPIGIEVEGNSCGEITVRRCYFSGFYTAPVCDLISSLDDGFFAGLSGGGRLVFSERLTEGCACCRAKLLIGAEGG